MCVCVCVCVCVCGVTVAETLPTQASHSDKTLHPSSPEVSIISVYVMHLHHTCFVCGLHR